MIFREIEDLKYDMKTIISHAEAYKRDAERGVNVAASHEAEGYPKEKQVEHLISYLVDAKHDFDRLRDEMKEVLDYLTKMSDTLEYEMVAKEIR